MKSLLLIVIMVTVKMMPTNQKDVDTSLDFPKVTEFLSSPLPNIISRTYHIKDCRVKILSGSCMFTVIPDQSQCLTLGKVISILLPKYLLMLANREVREILPIRCTVFYINTCLEKITFITSAEGKLPIIPKVLRLAPMVAELSIPIPFGEYELTARGSWKIDEYQITMKVTKVGFDEYVVSGTTQQEFLPIKTLARKFDVDSLPSGAVRILLQNLGLEDFLLRRVKVHGTLATNEGNYELVFSGSPELKDIDDVHIRIFIVKRNNYKNFAMLIEFSDYSPVTLMKRMFGSSVSRISLLRDRNQTLALFVTTKPMTNFTQVLVSHGSSRWLHSDSNFESGASLLVTLPFPKRKAFDMKIQIFSDGLGFTLPEGENLPADLALGAILPSTVKRIDRKDKEMIHLDREDQISKFNKMLILRFRYYLFNDTYVAAAEQLNAEEEELKELMPTVKPSPKALIDFLASNTPYSEKQKLDLFFKRSYRKSEKEALKPKISAPISANASNVVNAVLSKPVYNSTLKSNNLELAKKMGLLR